MKKEHKLAEEIFGTGAIRDKKDKRDFKYKDAVVALGIAPFDWEKGYDVEELIGKKLEVKNQGSSGSCGGQAWGYYGEVLDADKDQKSAKFIYSQTYVLPAGSDGRTNCQLVKTKGWGTEALTPSYEGGMPPTEEFMQRKEDITSGAFAQALTDKALSYASPDKNIDALAQALRENKGVIIGISGRNNGTWTTQFPVPPLVVNNECWNHWVYIGKAKLINGKKFLGFINSWGEMVGDHGWQWIGEDYAKTPYIWNAWTLVYNYPKFIFKNNMKIGSRLTPDVKELQKRLGVIQTGLFWVLTQKAVVNYQKEHGLQPDGIVGPLTRAELNK